MQRIMFMSRAGISLFTTSPTLFFAHLFAHYAREREREREREIVCKNDEPWKLQVNLQEDKASEKLLVPNLLFEEKEKK